MKRRNFVVAGIVGGSLISGDLLANTVRGRPVVDLEASIWRLSGKLWQKAKTQAPLIDQSWVVRTHSVSAAVNSLIAVDAMFDFDNSGLGQFSLASASARGQSKNFSFNATSDRLRELRWQVTDPALGSSKNLSIELNNKRSALLVPGEYRVIAHRAGLSPWELENACALCGVGTNPSGIFGILGLSVASV